MPVRLRFPELLAKRGLTAYALAKACRGVLSRSMAYRLVQERGAFRCLSPEQIDVLCTVLEVAPGDLIAKAAPKGKGKR